MVTTASPKQKAAKKSKSKKKRAERQQSSPPPTAALTPAALKRARLVAKFKGKTDAEILGKSSPLSLHSAYSCTFQKSSRKGGGLRSISISSHRSLYMKMARSSINLRASGKSLISTHLSDYTVCSCNSRKPSVQLTRERYEDSTTNLKRHVDVCDPSDTPASQQITAFANGTTYSPAKFRYLLAMWCARRHRLFIIIEDQEFCDIFRMLYDRVDIPSRVTISRDVREMFEHCRHNVSQVLLVCIHVSCLFNR